MSVVGGISSARYGSSFQKQNISSKPKRQVSDQAQSGAQSARGAEISKVQQQFNPQLQNKEWLNKPIGNINGGTKQIVNIKNAVEESNNPERPLTLVYQGTLKNNQFKGDINKQSTNDLGSSFRANVNSFQTRQNFHPNHHSQHIGNTQLSSSQQGTMFQNSKKEKYLQLQQIIQLKKMHTRLYEKFSQSQNYYYTRDINDLLGQQRTRFTIKYKDWNNYDEEEEYLKRMYKLKEYPSKIKLLTEYYKFHSDIARLFMQPQAAVVNHMHDKKRRIEFYRIAKVIEEENKKNPNKTPKGIVGDAPVPNTEESVQLKDKKEKQPNKIDKELSCFLKDISSFVNRESDDEQNSKNAKSNKNIKKISTNNQQKVEVPQNRKTSQQRGKVEQNINTIDKNQLKKNSATFQDLQPKEQDTLCSINGRLQEILNQTNSVINSENTILDITENHGLDDFLHFLQKEQNALKNQENSSKLLTNKSKLVEGQVPILTSQKIEIRGQTNQLGIIQQDLQQESKENKQNNIQLNQKTEGDEDQLKQKGQTIKQQKQQPTNKDQVLQKSGSKIGQDGKEATSIGSASQISNKKKEESDQNQNIASPQTQQQNPQLLLTQTSDGKTNTQTGNPASDSSLKTQQNQLIQFASTHDYISGNNKGNNHGIIKNDLIFPLSKENTSSNINIKIKTNSENNGQCKEVAKAQINLGNEKSNQGDFIDKKIEGKKTQKGQQLVEQPQQLSYSQPQQNLIATVSENFPLSARAQPSNSINIPDLLSSRQLTSNKIAVKNQIQEIDNVAKQFNSNQSSQSSTPINSMEYKQKQNTQSQFKISKMKKNSLNSLNSFQTQSQLLSPRTDSREDQVQEKLNVQQNNLNGNLISNFNPSYINQKTIDKTPVETISQFHLTQKGSFSKAAISDQQFQGNQRQQQSIELQNSVQSNAVSRVMSLKASSPKNGTSIGFSAFKQNSNSNTNIPTQQPTQISGSQTHRPLISSASHLRQYSNPNTVSTVQQPNLASKVVASGSQKPPSESNVIKGNFNSNLPHLAMSAQFNNPIPQIQQSNSHSSPQNEDYFQNKQISRASVISPQIQQEGKQPQFFESIKKLQQQFNTVQPTPQQQIQINNHLNQQQISASQTHTQFHKYTKSESQASQQSTPLQFNIPNFALTISGQNSQKFNSKQTFSTQSSPHASGLFTPSLKLFENQASSINSAQKMISARQQCVSQLQTAQSTFTASNQVSPPASTTHSTQLTLKSISPRKQVRFASNKSDVSGTTRIQMIQ